MDVIANILNFFIMGFLKLVDPALAGALGWGIYLDSWAKWWAGLWN